METIKVKDMRFTITIVYAFCVFPLIFFLIFFILCENKLLAFAVTLAIYFLAALLYFKLLKRNEDVYIITANKDSITFGKNSNYRWNEIISIETFRESPWWSRMQRSYIKFNFINDQEIVLDASSFDFDYIELASKLKRFLITREVK